ncbi:MAG: type II toxin-antitoxin system RelE/ParE family toxin [Candidatus Marinimicrobia bacterium]|nr:type II toxin-antitoxin system RelE/ParE family toxin [Candidatus Neomarinimicrobiota bacterium]
MKFDVFLTSDAEEDIFEIYSYVADIDSIQKADNLFSNLKKACLSLEVLPSRGHIPPELDRMNVRDYLEIHFKPYRILYQIRGTQVFVHCILHGKRSLQDLLQKRLLR